MIGSRLRLARAAQGLSLRALARRINGIVTAQAIGKYERDEMMPSSGVLIRLASALGVSVGYLLRPPDLQLEKVEFRKQYLTSAKDKASVRARVLDAVRRYAELEELLAIDKGLVLPRSFPRSVSTMEEVERAARDLRQYWHLGRDPIPNLRALLEEKGIKIQALELPEGVSGLQAEVKARDERSIPVIVVNAQEPGDRQRFTLAHELAHIVLQPQHASAPEKMCQRFAGAFLITPEALVRETGARRRAISVRELFRLKALFGVSAQAVAYRCRDLGIFNEALFSSVFRLFGRNQWRRKEPYPLEAEESRRFERLVLRALSEDVITDARAAELLDVPTWKLTNLLDSPPEGPSHADSPRM